jgi:hypothetical protein
LLIWALVLAFVFHNPGPQIGVGTKDIVSVIEALFASGSGLLTSFGKDLGTIAGLVLLLVYGPGLLAIDKMVAEEYDRLSLHAKKWSVAAESLRMGLINIRDIE